MKTHRRLLLLAATLGLFALAGVSAPATDNTPVAYAVHQVDKWNGSVTPGTSKWVAEMRLGRPAHRLTPDVWVYTGYRADLDRVNRQGCNILIVTLANGRVARMQFANQPAFQVIADDARSTPRATIVAGK